MAAIAPCTRATTHVTRDASLQLLRILMQGQKEAWGADKASMAAKGKKKKYAYTAKDFWDGVDGWRVPDGFDASDPDASCVYFDRLTMSRIDFDEYYSPAGIVVDRLGGPRAPAADEGEL